MRDLIEHYKTLISANLFEGEKRQKRLLLARLKDPANDDIRAAYDRATEKSNRRNMAMARKAKAKAFVDARLKKPDLDFNAVSVRSGHFSDRQQKQMRDRMGRLNKEINNP